MATLIAVYNSEGCVGRCDAARRAGQDITLAELAVDAQHEPLFSLGGAS